MDGEFDMEQFYWNIVKFFENAGDYGVQLLQWWDRWVAVVFLTLYFKLLSLGKCLEPVMKWPERAKKAHRVWTGSKPNVRLRRHAWQSHLRISRTTSALGMQGQIFRCPLCHCAMSTTRRTDHPLPCHSLALRLEDILDVSFSLILRRDTI